VTLGEELVRPNARDKKLEEHWQAVRTDAEDYEEARRREDAASSETTAALNALNAAQKLFDAAVAELKSIAPRGSDWKR